MQSNIRLDCVDNSLERLDVLNSVFYPIKFIDTKNEYTIFSDSQLTINCATNKWKRKSNIDLWNEYDVVAKDKNITFEWIKSHNGNKYNEMVDKIAYKEANNKI